MRSYKIRYTIETGDFAEDQVDIRTQGLCDAMLFASVNEEPDGGTSTVWVSREGDGVMTSAHRFMHWGILANQLAEGTGLGSKAQRICRSAFTRIQGLVKELK